LNAPVILMLALCQPVGSGALSDYLLSNARYPPNM